MTFNTVIDIPFHHDLSGILANTVLPSILPVLLGGGKKPVVVWETETIFSLLFSATFDLFSCLPKQFHTKTHEFLPED